jgi:hypothetical protein
MSMELQINRSWVVNIAHGLYYGLIRVGTPAYHRLVLMATSSGYTWDEIEAQIVGHVRFLICNHVKTVPRRNDDVEFERLWAGL